VRQSAAGAFATSLGLGSVQADCVTGAVLSVDGNAITLAKSLFNADDSLRPLAGPGREPLVIGIPFLYSAHHFLLRTWLRAHGLVPGRDVRLVVVPPPQMPANLKARHLDGYCVGEPWNAVAVLSGYGRRAAASADIAPHHPEKVLLVRRSFAEARAEEHERLIAALLEACRFCADPANRERVIATLVKPQYVSAPVPALRASLNGGLEFAPGPFGPDASEPGHPNEPSAAKAKWVLDNLVECGLLSPAVADRTSVSNIFRADIFHAALPVNQPYETSQITARHS
jgi:ABC-type nitrate/sulfonate/bicarbonate transport system substrate-binding protein